MPDALRVRLAARRAWRPKRCKGALHLPPKLLIRRLARALEFLNQRVIRPRVNIVGGKHGGLATGTGDFSLEPFEILARLRRIGQRVDSLLDGNRAELLKSAPGLHAQIGRLRRKLVNEEQPSTIAGGSLQSLSL